MKNLICILSLCLLCFCAWCDEPSSDDVIKRPIIGSLWVGNSCWPTEAFIGSEDFNTLEEAEEFLLEFWGQDGGISTISRAQIIYIPSHESYTEGFTPALYRVIHLDWRCPEE